MISLGIDIGGSSIKTALLRNGEVIAMGKSGSFTRPSTDELVAALREATRGLAGIGRVGLCCPGVLDRAARRITLAVNVPGLVGVSLDELIGQAISGPLDRPAEILTDSAAVAFDLWSTRKLAGRLLCLAVGTGVGAAVIDEPGKFLHVTGETPGHMGQIDVSMEEDAPIGPDSGRGSLEAYLGAGALAGKRPEELGLDDRPIRALVRALRIGHAIYRPQHIAVAGGVGIRLKHLGEELKREVSRELTSVARAGWTLFFGEHDHHAACGAGRVVS